MKIEKGIKVGKEIFVSWDTFNLLYCFLVTERFYDFDSIIEYLLKSYFKEQQKFQEQKQLKEINNHQETKSASICGLSDSSLGDIPIIKI